MSQYDWLVLLGMGGLFILLGLGAIIWDKREKKSYYNTISAHKDVREYLVHQPERPELGALKIGGWIAIAIGLVMIAVGGANWCWG